MYKVHIQKKAMGPFLPSVTLYQQFWFQLYIHKLKQNNWLELRSRCIFKLKSCHGSGLYFFTQNRNAISMLKAPPLEWPTLIIAQP